MDKDLAFEIFTIKDGKKDKIWKIYLDGRIEGFGDRCLIINHTFPKIQVLKYLAQSINETYRDFVRNCLLSDFFPLDNLNNIYKKFRETIEKI